jgi:glucokinase
MTSTPAALIGVDVGCTTISCGLVTLEGTVLTTLQSPTRLGSGTGVDSMLCMISDLCEEGLSRRLTVEAVGIGVPGLIDVERGLLRSSAGSHVADFEGLPLADRVHAKTGLPAFVDNDVNALALAEWLFGLGRGCSSCVVLALGSGVGAGMILDDRLVRGKSGYAGELGHVPVDLDGPPCMCGGRGCLSVYAAGEMLAARARDGVAREPSSMLALAGGDLDAITAETVFRAAETGDALASRMVSRSCQALGAGLALVVNALDPEVVVVTGGVVKSLMSLEGEIMRRAREYALAEALAKTRIHFSPGDKRQTVRGGAALVLYERARRAGPS